MHNSHGLRFWTFHYVSHVRCKSEPESTGLFKGDGIDTTTLRCIGCCCCVVEKYEPCVMNLLLLLCTDREEEPATSEFYLDSLAAPFIYSHIASSSERKSETTPKKIHKTQRKLNFLYIM